MGDIRLIETGYRMVAMRPGQYLLIDTDADEESDDLEGRVLDTEQGRLFPPEPVVTIIAHGYWEDAADDQALLASLLADVSDDALNPANRSMSLRAAVPDPRGDAERRLRDALVGMFDKTSPEVAKRIAAGLPVSDEEMAEAFRAVLQPNLAQTATDEGLRLGVEIGVQFDPAVVNAAAVEWAKTYSYGLVKDITDHTMDVISRATESFIGTPGKTVGQLRDALNTNLGPAFGPVRAQLIAVTETTRAFSAATMHYQRMLSDSGISMLKRWNTAADELVCPLCFPLNGLLETKWDSDSIEGPPRHVNCRCSTSLALAPAKPSTNGKSVTEGLSILPLHDGDGEP